MRIFQQTTLALSIIASCALTTTASAHTEIADVKLVDLHSATFDGLVFGIGVVDDGSFFGSIPGGASPTFGVNRAVNVTHVPGFPGAGSLTFNGTQLDSLSVTLPDLVLTIIDGPTTTTQVQASGASLSMGNIPHFDGGADSNFDVGGPLSAASAQIEADFSTFNALAAGQPGVVKQCTDATGTVPPTGGSTGTCTLLPALNLDGVRYTLEGTPSTSGGDVLTLRVQTSNNSYYVLELTTAIAGKNVPVPGLFIWLTALGLGLAGLRLRK